MAKKEKTQAAPKKALPVWLVKRRFQEGERVYMPGDVYEGPNVERLGPEHPWVKAKWLEEQKESDPADDSDKELEKTE